ncbi:MAG: hypothetical protein ABFR05_03235 [Bacteroidota bacterium]
MVKSPLTNTTPNNAIIKMHQFIQFLKVGYFLHISFIIGIFIFIFGLTNIIEITSSQSSGNILWYSLLTFAGGTIPFFAFFDALGRYQNYKQIKDKLFEFGYDVRLIKPFMHSKCQRDAVLVAANDLDYKKEVEKLFYKKGYRWYHIFPDAFVKNPLILFNKVFWQRILFTKYYQLQNFYW